MIENKDILINHREVYQKAIKKNIFGFSKNIFFVLLIIYFVFNLFQNSQVVCEGVSRALSLCGDVVFPSLFPFMVVCNLLSLLPGARLVSLCLKPITKYIFKLPERVGYLIFFSFIGGYPMGAKLLADALQRKEISLQTANRLICFCVNAGPAFVVTAIGLMICGSKKMGIYLLIAHVFGSIFVGFLTRFFFESSKESKESKKSGELQNHKTERLNFDLNFVEAFVKSVVDSFGSVLHISAFVVVFSVIAEIARKSLLSFCFVSRKFLNMILSFLEVTVGMKAIVEEEGTISLALCAFLISFSGLSVICQVFYFLRNYEIDKMMFLFFRFLHAMISVAIIYIISFFIKDTWQVFVVFFEKPVEFFQLSPEISLMILFFSICFVVFSSDELGI